MTGSTETQDDGAHLAPRRDEGRDEPHLFVVLECDRPTAAGARFGLEGVGRVVIGRGTARAARREAKDGVITLHLEVPGRSMSRSHARLVRWHGQWVLEDLQSKNGVFVDGQRVERWAFAPSGGLFELGHTLFSIAPRLPTPAGTVDVDAGLPAEGPAELKSLVPLYDAQAKAFALVARSRVSLLLCGETGTGKELFARAAHELSREGGPFVAVNCGAIAPALAEGQLFGYEKGAFLGAERGELGFVRAADGGTLFLDGLGDLPPGAQAALLRVLDGHDVVPAGGSRGVRVDVRVVAADHRSLEAAAAGGAFRADLLARVAGYTHTLPPLRDRIVDLGAVIARTLRLSPHVEAPDKITFDPAAGRALVRYTWPLNGREVRQCIEAALVLARDGVILPAHLPPAVAGSAQAPAEAPLETPDPSGDDELRTSLEAALRDARGNVAEVARAFNKGPTQIHRWMKRFGLNPTSFRRP